MLISVFDPRDDAFPEGRPVVFVAGLVFFFAGVAILVPALGRGRDTTALQAAIGTTLLSGFAAIPVLIALGGHALPLVASIAVLGVLVMVAWDRVVELLIPRWAARLCVYAGLVLALAFVAGRRPTAGPARQRAQAGPVFERVTLGVERDAVAPGDPVRVTFDPALAMPPGFRYRICIVPTGSEVHGQGRWCSDLDQGVTAVELEAPHETGEYEVRLHPHPNAVIASVPLLVRTGAMPRTRPDVERR